MLYIDKLNTDAGVEIKVEPNELVELKKKIFAAYRSNKQFQKLAYEMEIAWLNTIKKEYSPLMDIFYGQLVSQVICGNCKHIHHNYEVYSSLPLPLVNTKEEQTYEDLLQAYFAREYINTNDNDKGWKCDNCKESVKSPKCLKLYRTPMVFIVTLKRFDANLRKSGAKVSMPFELDLTRYSLRDDGCKYHLSSVAHHQGGMGSGHYNCICHHKKGTWMAIDDILVREASNDEVEHVMNYGYVYFYERV
jgi:ubiquitin C-terminal hydrolase